MKKSCFLLSICFLFHSSLFSQRNCGTMLHEEHLEATFKGYSSEATRQSIANISQTKNNFKESNAIITIPVVVHVVYKNATQNISDAQINSQITVLNNDFGRTNADASNTRSVFNSIVGPSNIRFQLATVDPSGNPTTGITRTSTPTSSYFDTGDQVKSASSGGKAPWNTAEYLNMWVCELGGGILGYAQFPGGPASTDGVVMGYNYFGTTGVVSAPYNKGRTATHEVGHFLGLYHIWGDAPGCTPDDQISDTPASNDAYYSACAPDNFNTCGSGASDLPDMYENYMDYVNDACMNAFTNNQIARMENILATTRSTLPTTSAPTVNCTPVSLPFVEGFETSSGLPSLWTLSNPDGATTWARNTSVKHSGNASYAINLFDYSTSEGQRDGISTPALNLGPISGEFLQFWVAYAPYSDADGLVGNDTLYVFASTDCGASWSQLYKKGGNDLSTAPGLSSAFVPLDNQWRQETINISSAALTNIKFETKSEWGNWLYIDDINITNVVDIEESVLNNILIFPNPVQSILNINAENIDMKSLTITNLLGEVIYSQNTEDKQINISTSDFAAGIYFVNINDGQNVYSKKIIIQK